MVGFNCIFQSTHPSGVRLIKASMVGFNCIFQSTHPSGVRPSYRDVVRFVSRISIHAPQWGATMTVKTHIIIVRHFNPRTPVGCDTTRRTPNSRKSRFQSTHPSGVRQYALGVPFEHVVISIHAPQWGATQAVQPRGLAVGISIHAPQWGATVNVLSTSPVVLTFQSTHPSGVRPGHEAVVPPKTISIHAPQWGATGDHAGFAKPIQDFNPRTPVGCDAKRPCLSCRFPNFNPRTPVGCDLSPAEAVALAY